MVTHDEPVVEASAERLGRRLFRRIGVREKSRLQDDFLRWFSATPFVERISLCGGVALHKAYLHGRLSKDLDFRANSDDIVAFGAFIEESEISWECQNDPKPVFSSKRFTLSRHQGIYRIDLAVELFPCDQPQRSQLASVQLSNGQALPLRVQPLRDLVTYKIFFALLRSNTSDFCDLWMAFTKYPVLAVDARNLLESVPKDIHNFHYPSFDPTRFFENLAQCRMTWNEDIREYSVKAPPYEEVSSLLHEWIRSF